MTTMLLTRLRRPVLVIAILCVIAIVAVIWYQAASGSRSGAGGSARPTVTWTPPAATASPGALDEAQVETLTEDLLVAVSAALAAPETADASQALTGAALEEFENQRQEWEANGWYQENAATVDDVAILSTAPDGSSLTAQMCVDSSDLRVMDETGAEVRSSEAPQRSAMVFTFVLVEGRWLLSEQAFAEDPEC